MRKHTIIGAAVLLLLVSIPFVSYAKMPLSLGMGGRVITTPSDLKATIMCTASYGPFFIQPYNIAPSGPYFIKLAKSGTPRRSGYILGLYKIIPDTSTCYNPESGAPIPAFNVVPYGVSR